MSANICETIEKDEFYHEFFNSDETRDVGKIVSTVSISDQIKKLTDGVELLANELQSQVRQQHGALLLQASHASKLTSALDAVNSHMSQLEAGAERLKTQINAPYELLENQTRVLARLHDASHLLRRSGRFLQLFRGLQAESKDLAAQATIFFELEPFIDDEQLNQVDFIRDERASAIVSRQRLNNLAYRNLMNALKNGQAMDQQKVVSSLQIFTNLQTLPKCIDELLETFVLDIKHSIKECFAGTDISVLSSKKSKIPQNNGGGSARSGNNKQMRGPGKTPTLTTSQHFRTKLWTALEWLFDEEIFHYWTQVAFLENCMENVSQTPVTAHLFQNIDIKTRFWQSLENLLRVSFADCPVHINQCLKQDLPKLLQFARSLQAKFGQKFTFSDNVFESLEAGYLEKCAINLKAPLIGTDMPTQESVDGLIQTAEKELRAAFIDNRLCMMIAAAFTACNKDFWTKIEAHIKLGTDSQQVVDVPNACQLQNITLANTIFYHNVLVKRMIQNLGTNFANSLSAQKIQESLHHGTNIVTNILEQLMISVKSAANIILLSVHREPGLNSDRTISSGPSLYMKELQEFLHRAWNLHIAPFADKQLVDVFGRELAERCIDLFVWNVAIIRPISMPGRQRLRSDCQHLETALNPIVGDLTVLGRPFRLLRSLSTLITLTPEEIANQSIEIDSPVSPFVILLLLFGHAGNDLASPHAAAGWTNEKIINWLDSHTVLKERLELVTGALQKYRTIIRQRNLVQYDPVYPFISNYLEKVSKSLL